MYQELKGNENFSDKYATWIIAYCLDTDSFFATNLTFLWLCKPSVYKGFRGQKFQKCSNRAKIPNFQ